MQPRRKVQKYPLLYSLAEGVLLLQLGGDEGDKTFSNKCAQQFVNYIKTVDFDRDYQKAQKINESINGFYSYDKQKMQQQEYMRNMIQALSFNFTPDQAYEVFPKAMGADVPIQKQNSTEKKTGRMIYQEMYKILNSPS